jgi:hypothetical protein
MFNGRGEAISVYVQCYVIVMAERMAKLTRALQSFKLYPDDAT